MLEDDGLCSGETARRWGPTAYAALNGLAAVAALVVLILVADGGSDLEARSHGASAVVLSIGSVIVTEAVVTAAMQAGVPASVARVRELAAAAAIGAVASSIAVDGLGDRCILVAGSALVFVGTASAVVAVVWTLTVDSHDAF